MKYYSPRTATAVIIANMVGAGVFLSLGQQLLTLESTFPVLVLWLCGGIASLCGAMSYAELGGMFAKNGGEYNFLTQTYHPSAGFVSGWISATVGFAAPIAAVAMGFGKYVTSIIPTLPDGSNKLLAVALVLLATWFHTRSRKNSSRFQMGFTILKVAIILLFCLFALWLAPDPQPVNLLPVDGDMNRIFDPAFAVALIYVSFSYAGWNAATYIIGEMKNPQKDLPKVLISGTAFVTFLYVLINFVLLKTAPISALKGQEEIIYISAQYAFGEHSSQFIGLMLASLLISSVGAMTLAGPRAIQAIGEDYKLFSFLGAANKNGQPMRAIAFQSFIAILLIVTSSFKTILIFAGAMLALNSFVAVLGIIVLRIRAPELERPYKVLAYPFIPLIFLTINGLILIYTIMDNPFKALVGAALLIAGFAAYFISVHFENSNADKAQ